MTNVLSFDWIVRRSLTAGLLVMSTYAFAVLGQDVSSVQADGARMNSVVRVETAPAYSVHEMVSPAGATVREFVSASGQVFAIAWQGPYTPDLQQLLGDYFEQYMHAAQTSPRNARHVVHIETDDLVFESAGHMRFIVGRAYLRNKLPDGATVDAIR